MNTHQSHLRCINYFVTDLVITANPKHNRNNPLHLDFRDLQINCKTEKSEVQTEQKWELWRVSLQVAQNVSTDKNSPYNFTISILGQFIVHPDYPADKIEQLVSINGCSLLYTTAREILRSAMAHGPFHPLLLPTVCFSEPEIQSQQTDLPPTTD